MPKLDPERIFINAKDEKGLIANRRDAQTQRFVKVVVGAASAANIFGVREQFAAEAAPARKIVLCASASPRFEYTRRSFIAGF